MEPSKPAHVLVVDDEPDVRDFVCIILEEAGFVVDTAEDGRLGLEKIASERPDLVVLDIMMPVMDGWAVLARVRKKVHPPVVVILSAYAERDRALKAGAAACLTKPFLPGELVTICRQVLAAH